MLVSHSHREATVMASSCALRITPAAVRKVEDAVGLQVFRHPSLFVNDPNIIGDDMAVPKRKTQVQIEVETVKNLIKEKAKLERQIVTLKKRSASKSNRVILALRQYKKISVGVRKYESQVTRTNEQKQLAREFAKRCCRLRFTKLSLEKKIASKDLVIDKYEIALDELKTHIKQLDLYIAEKERDIARQQHFIDKCMLHLKTTAKGAAVCIPSVTCIDCKLPRPLFYFQARVPRTVGTAKSWAINPVCNGCRKERLKRVDKARKEKRIAYDRFMRTGEEESTEQREQRIGTLADKMAETALHSVKQEDV